MCIFFCIHFISITRHLPPINSFRQVFWEAGLKRQGYIHDKLRMEKSFTLIETRQIPERSQ